MLVQPGQSPARAARITKLDLREFQSPHHVSVLFERLDDLRADDHLFVICGYDPAPLRRKMQDWCPGEFDWSWIGTGPRVWGAEITAARHREGMA